MEMASLRVLALGCRRWGGVRPRKGWDAGIKTSELVEASLRPSHPCGSPSPYDPFHIVGKRVFGCSLPNCSPQHSTSNSR
jgi:hypothetical protein